MTTKYKVYWDIGHACGEFPEVYDTHEQAFTAAEDILQENQYEHLWDDSCSVEVIEVEIPDDESEEIDGFDPMRDGWMDKNGRP